MNEPNYFTQRREMKTEKTEDAGSNIINFQEAVKRLEPKRKRQVVMSDKNNLKLLQFLYDAFDGAKRMPEILSANDTDLLEELSRDVAHSIIYSRGELSLSRVDIDKIGEWFEIFKPISHREQRKASFVIVDLDRRFVKVGGLENPDFMKEVS